MLQFLKFVGATIVGLFLFALIAIFVLVGIASSLGTSEKPKVEENSVLLLNLSRPIAERGSENNPLEDLDLPISAVDGKLGLLEIVQAIKR